MPQSSNYRSFEGGMHEQFVERRVAETLSDTPEVLTALPGGPARPCLPERWRTQAEPALRSTIEDRSMPHGLIRPVLSVASKDLARVAAPLLH